jgi:hypothetical protein
VKSTTYKQLNEEIQTMKKGFVFIVVMMAISTIAYAQDPCDGVTCESGWDGPYSKEVCYINENEDTIRFDVCYCVDNSNPVPRFRIEQADLGWSLGVSNWDQKIWWAGMDIAEDLYQCAPPDKYGNCSSPANAYIDEEVWKCWAWEVKTHGGMQFYQLVPCDTMVCLYVDVMTCDRYTNPTRCCVRTLSHYATISDDCDPEGHENCISGCTSSYPNGRLCSSECANQ